MAKKITSLDVLDIIYQALRYSKQTRINDVTYDGDGKDGEIILTTDNGVEKSCWVIRSNQITETEVEDNECTNSKVDVYCDHCACKMIEGTGNPITKLPFDVMSVNEGESAILCDTCLREKGWAICYVCHNPVEIGDGETMECGKCGKFAHVACDKGFHTPSHLSICSECMGKSS